MKAKQFIVVCERVCYLLGAGVVGAWLMGARPISKDEVRTYHFKGEFCGMELWEYSARGDEVAIWCDFITNSDLTVHMVVRSNTVENWLRSQR